MKIQRYAHLVLILLICMLTISAVSAAEDSASNIISADDNEPILEESINDAQTNTNKNELKSEESINEDVSISTNNDEEPILEDTYVDELDDNVNEKPALSEGESGSSSGTDEIDYANARIDVNDLTTVYGSGDKLIFNLTSNGVTYDNAYARIYVRYEHIDLIVGENDKIWALSGENNGWGLNIISGVLYPGRYQIVLIPSNPNNGIQGQPAHATLIISTKLVSTYDTMNLSLGETCPVEYTLNPSDARGEISFTSSDPSIVTVDSTGTMKALKEGEATITIKFAETIFYDNPETSVKVKVGKKTTKLTAPDVTTNYNVNKDLVITLKDNNGKTLSGFKITVDLNGADEYITDNNGQVKVATGNLVPKTYTAKISFAGNENYTASSTTAKVTVNKLSTKLTATDLTTTYKENKNLVITLKDNEGRAMSGVQVTVNLNGNKKYTTDNNGQVKVATGNLVPKAYTVKISFAGNEKYNASSTTAKVTVKKATPKITAKAKTFKNEDKTKTYTITLKNNKGALMKNTKVSIKVDGKTYNATTDSKGVATFKLTKLTKKGTYNAVITYAGNKYYNKASVKAKITVKAPAWKTIARGSKDSAMVKKIQRALKNNGYYLSYKGHYLKVDGIFESCTERSVKQFQKAKGLKVTGKVDYATAKKLKIVS